MTSYGKFFQEFFQMRHFQVVKKTYCLGFSTFLICKQFPLNFFSWPSLAKSENVFQPLSKPRHIEHNKENKLAWRYPCVCLKKESMIPCVSGEGKRRNEFAEWHVACLAEWHNYAEFNIRSWMIQRNKLNWKERPFWRQSICKRSRCFNVAGLTYDGNQKITKAHCRPAFSAKRKRFFVYWRKYVFEGHAPFYFNFFCKRYIHYVSLNPGLKFIQCQEAYTEVREL